MVWSSAISALIGKQYILNYRWYKNIESVDSRTILLNYLWLHNDTVGHVSSDFTSVFSRDVYDTLLYNVQLSAVIMMYMKGENSIYWQKVVLNLHHFVLVIPWWHIAAYVRLLYSNEKARRELVQLVVSNAQPSLNRARRSVFDQNRHFHSFSHFQYVRLIHSPQTLLIR